MTGPEWQPTGNYTTRRECPLCDWFMDEPPMETASELVGDQLVFRVRQRSAVPAGLAHIVSAHPQSEQAREILAEVGRRFGRG